MIAVFFPWRSTAKGFGLRSFLGDGGADFEESQNGIQVVSLEIVEGGGVEVDGVGSCVTVGGWDTAEVALATATDFLYDTP